MQAKPDRAVAAPSRARRALHPHRELLFAWTLLLLLDDGTIYGYELHRELQDRGLKVAPSSLYRALRRFERDEWVRSTWSEPIVGPRRHIYELTQEGRARLRVITALIAATRDTYSAFLAAHERAVSQRQRPDIDEQAIPVAHEPPTPREDTLASVSGAAAPQLLRPHKELLVGWLLLHLDGGPTYGYVLRRQFHAHQLEPHASAVYRMLRQLEADKWVQSRWLSSAGGPRRRFYRLTTRGRRNLDEIADLVGAIRDAHDAYLGAYERAT